MDESRYNRSRAMLAEARKSLVGGASSPFRSKLPVPLFFEHACGPWLRDVDGNKYIDYVLAWGPLILGHCHPKLVDAIRGGAETPHIYGAQHVLERQVAGQVQSLVPCAQRVAFTSSGSEAVQCALRLARAFTARTLTLKFEGHYHGWMDSTLISYRGAADQLGPAGAPRPLSNSKGQVPNALDNVVVAEWNDEHGVEHLFGEHPDSIAAVICEPVVCNSGSLEPNPGFLEALRRITTQYGALLIFDEVITGFRIANGGAQSVFGVTPDLATFGKAAGGGMPLSIIAGREDVLDQMASGEVVFGGTFNGNPLSLAGAKATLDELTAGDGAALRHANRMGLLLREGLVKRARAVGLPLQTTGFGAAFSVHFRNGGTPRTYRDTLSDDRDRLQRFVRMALDEGLYLLPDGRIYVSAVHGEREVAETLDAATRVFANM